MPMLWEPRMITFKVADFENVKSFYKAVLSLRIIEDEPDLFVTFELGGIKLRLEHDYNLKLPENFGISSQIIFSVRSIRDILEVLHKLNVDYMLDELPDGKHLDIVDPEGRMITFISKF